jgi:serine/threonine protein kinase
MADFFEFEPWKGFQSQSGTWYRAIELLGVGGNAATFLACCTSSPKKGLLFAVKVFRKLSRPDRRDSFLEEAKFLQTCDHPAIMRTYDEGIYYEHPFVVMEYLPRTLSEVMRRGCSMVEKVAFSIQLVSALEYLDSLEPPVIHRDIKPPNIFIKGGSCVLGDFGLMKRLMDDASVIKESIGPGMAFYYRTPDLVAYLRGEAGITTKSDVFQLGLVLAQLFTGWNPAKASHDFTAPVELDPLGNIPSKLSGTVAALLNRMLIYDPDRRPAAREIIDGWQGAFKTAVDAAHNVEDRAFQF